MKTLTQEIADGIYRFSTCVPDAAPGGFTFNQSKLADGEVIDLGGRRVRHLDTPHVPHNWEARVLFEETTRTLFCGDLFTHTGDGPALTTDDIVGPALAAEDIFRATALSVGTAPTIRHLATLEPRTLALMHGSSTQTGCSDALLCLADAYAARLEST